MHIHVLTFEVCFFAVACPLFFYTLLVLLVLIIYGRIYVLAMHVPIYIIIHVIVLFSFQEDIQAKTAQVTQYEKQVDQFKNQVETRKEQAQILQAQVIL